MWEQPCGEHMPLLLNASLLRYNILVYWTNHNLTLGILAQIEDTNHILNRVT